MTVSLLDGYTFTDDTIPDSIPQTTDVEFPCSVCGREAGPYSGRGRKPTKCTEHKPARASGVRITGNAANLAAQAAKTLVQANSIIGVLAAAAGLFGTAGAIAAYQETFEAQAYAALSTDPKLCQMILKSGSKSAGLSLAIAYGGMGMAAVPVAMEEIRAKREARRVMNEDQAAHDDVRV